MSIATYFQTNVLRTIHAAKNYGPCERLIHMSGIANIFSTIDSAKRVLGDRLSGGVVADLQKTLGRAKEDAQQFSDTQKAGGRAAEAAMLSMAMNVMPGGMIVPANRMLGFQAFNKARKDLAAGADPESVFNSVGVYSQPGDDVLRAVISDLGATLTGNKLAKTLGEHLVHPELFAKFPELRNIKLIRDANSQQSAYVPADLTAGIEAYMRIGTKSDELLGTLHETEHAIQSISGMPGGGNVSSYIADPIRLKKAEGLASTAYNKLDDAWDKAARKAGFLESSVEARALPEFAAREAARIDSNNLYNALITIPYMKYAALPGETEARLVEAMYKAGKGAETFPPRFQSAISDLNRVDPIVEHYTDLQPTIRKLLDKFVPRKPTK